MKRSIVLTILLAACSGENLDVGDNGENGASGGTGGTAATGGTGGGGSSLTPSGPTLPDWSAVGACPSGDSLAPFVGTWEGAIEDFFLNPITPLRLTIDDAALDGVCGTFAWGVGSPPPQSLADPANRGEEFSAGGQPGYQLREGFTYTIVAGAARDETLRVGITSAEYFEDYCALQEEVYYDAAAGGWQCLPPYASISWGPEMSGCTVHTTQGPVSYDMKRCAACTNAAYCQCNSAGCAAPATAQQLFDFTLERTSTGDRLVMPWQPEQTITLVRVE